jgi:hypothetical protein
MIKTKNHSFANGNVGAKTKIALGPMLLFDFEKKIAKRWLKFLSDLYSNSCDSEHCFKKYFLYIRKLPPYIYPGGIRSHYP